MAQRNRHRQIDWPEKLLVPFLVLLSFGGGMALNAFTIAEKIATKPYVEERFIEGKKYTDEKAALILKEAFEHSDANRQLLLTEFAKYNGSLGTLDVKIDMLQKSVDIISKESMLTRVRK